MITLNIERTGNDQFTVGVKAPNIDQKIPVTLPPITKPEEPQEPVTNAKVEASIVNGRVQIKGIDGTNPYWISNDFAADTPELFLFLLQRDKGKGNLKGIDIHNTLDPDWPFEKTQGHWANLALEGRSLKNYPFPFKGSTRALVKHSSGNLLNTVPEISDGATRLRDEARKCTAAKPLVVFMGGQTSTVASAFLMDKTIADKMVCLHINGFYDNKKIAHGYNTTDVVASEICARYLKYVTINVKFPENRKYWYDGKNLGLSLAQINALPAHVTKTMLTNWYNKSFKTEGMADAPGFLWFHNNALWKNFVKKRVDGSTTTGDDYDFIFITDHDWPAYGATLINEFKKLLSDAPPVVTPPTGGINTGFEEAIRTAAPGRTVVFNKGTYELPNINVPPGVNIDLGGSTILGKSPAPRWNDTGAVFMFDSPSPVDGNQTIRNGIVDGRQIVSGAVRVTNRNQVHIDTVNARETRFFGHWVQNCKNGSIKNFELHNCSSVEYRGTNNWASGACSFENIHNYEISHGRATSNRENGGYGFKAMYREKTIGNVRFHHLSTAMRKDSWWNNGQSKNIGFEIETTRIASPIEIFDCTFGNQISLAIGYPDQALVRVRNSTFELGGDTYAVETVLDNFEFVDCIVRGSQMLIANFQRQKYRWKNWRIRNIRFENPAGVPDWGGLYLIGHSGVQNVVIENVQHAPVKRLVHYMDVRGGVTVDGKPQ